MTKINLELNETDLYNALRGIINHNNADEIAKVLSYCIGYSDNASSMFFKTYLGDIAPTPLPEGTMIKVSPNVLTYKVKRDELEKAGLLEKDGNVIAIVKEFRGFHDRTTYYVKFTNIDENGNKYEETGFVNYKEILGVIEEF